MKDPAFLFYSKDFYMSTRMMMPEERACYIDLLIYQHQNGIIPDDIPRLALHCAGCSSEVIVQVLNQKFNQTVDGWFNQRMNQIINERSTFRPKKIASATLAGLISSSNLNKKQKESIKKKFKIEEFIDINTNDEEWINSLKSNIKEWFNNLVNQMVNNIGDGNGDGNGNEDKEKGITKGKNIDFVPEPFKQIVCDWLDYKRDRGECYKNDRSLKAFYSRLKDLSRGDPETAKKIVEKSMANNYQGIFELNENGRINSHTQREAEKRDSRKELEREALGFIYNTSRQTDR